MKYLLIMSFLEVHSVKDHPLPVPICLIVTLKLPIHNSAKINYYMTKTFCSYQLLNMCSDQSFSNMTQLIHLFI